jgi:serine/threonine protein kinase
MSSESSDFTIGEELGEGGFGLVCRGTFGDRDVAIKKVQIVRRIPDRAARECELMSELDHPNVLKLLHWEEKNEIRFS